MKLEGWIAISGDGTAWVVGQDKDNVLGQVAEFGAISWDDPIPFSGHISITIPPSGEGSGGSGDGP